MTFVGLYLAWPKHAWRSIRQAFTPKWKGNSTRFNYDLHRAGGLWVWILLMMLAFTGMSMNLHEQVFVPLVNTVAPMTPFPGEDEPHKYKVSKAMSIPLDEALHLARQHYRESGLAGPLGSIWLEPTKELYHFGFHSKEDLMKEHAMAWVSINAAKSVVLLVRPSEGLTLGDAIHDWQFPLHSGKAFGLAGRIVISILGLVTAILSVTGVLIWWKKYRKQKLFPGPINRIRPASFR